MKRLASRADGGPAGAGAAEHLHAVGRQHRAGPGSEDRDRLRRCAAVRHGHVRVPFPDGRRPAVHPRHAQRRRSADAGELARQGLAAGRRYRPRARCLEDQPAGAEAGRPQWPRYFARGEARRGRADSESGHDQPRRGHRPQRRPAGDDQALAGRFDSEQGLRAPLRRGRQEARDGRAGPHRQLLGRQQAARQRLLHADDSAARKTSG